MNARVNTAGAATPQVTTAIEQVQNSEPVPKAPPKPGGRLSQARLLNPQQNGGTVLPWANKQLPMSTFRGGCFETPRPTAKPLPDLDPGIVRKEKQRTDPDPGMTGKWKQQPDVDPGIAGRWKPQPNLDPGFTRKLERLPHTAPGCVPTPVPSGLWSNIPFKRGTPPSSVPQTPAPGLKQGGKAPATPSSSAFTSTPQKQAFKSVVHLDSSGSGVIVANKGDQYMMLTNEHCVRGKKVGDPVNFTLSNGTKLQGKIAALGGRNAPDGHDLAAVTFTSKTALTTAPLAKAEPKVDQKMFAIGYPFEGVHTKTSKPSDRVDAASGAIVTEGKITANRRDGEGQIQGEYGVVSTGRVIQGMSGGGMFDATTGELLAISGQSGHPIIPADVQDGKTFKETVGPNGNSVGISTAEVGQFLRQNKATVPAWAQR